MRSAEGARLFAASAALLSLGGGCSLGPNVLARSHLAYNEAVHTANYEEFLLNLVRLRYGEAPTFLGVDTISAQFEFEASLGGEFGLVEGESSRFGAPSIGYADRPTITFVPRRDEEFVRRFTDPIAVGTLARLIRSHRDLPRFFSFIVVRMNHLVNRHHEGDPAFDRAVALMGELHERHQLTFDSVERQVVASAPFPSAGLGAAQHLEAAKAGKRIRELENGMAELVTTVHEELLWIDPAAPEGAELRKLLGLREDRASYVLVEGVSSQVEAPRDHIALELRSISNAMQVLAHAVEVPPEHIESGIAAPEEISPVVKQFFRVRASTGSPSEAGLFVVYRDCTFCLPDTDLEAKRTFQLLCSLLHYQVASTAGVRAPVLTLPVK